jgi:hypothetical protein
MIDARIPLMGQGIDLQQIAMNAERLRGARAEREQAEAQAQNRSRLDDLLPRAAQGDQGAIRDIAGIDPEMFMKLDERQRTQAKERTADLVAAVRWADSPEKWEQVIEHYGREGVDLSQYRGQFGMRERAMLELGKIGEYLDVPKNDATSMQRNYEFLKQTNPQLADSYLRNQAEGSPLVIDNGDGTKTIYPRGMIGGQQGSAPPPPPPGFQLDNGGPTPPASGPFQP